MRLRRPALARSLAEDGVAASCLGVSGDAMLAPRSLLATSRNNTFFKGIGTRPFRLRERASSGLLPISREGSLTGLSKGMRPRCEANRSRSFYEAGRSFRRRECVNSGLLSNLS